MHRKSLHMDLQQGNKNHRQNLSHTLGELLNLVGEITNTEDDDDHHHHLQSLQVLELNETADTHHHHATTVPFILSFKNLSYSIKTRSKILPEFVSTIRHEPKQDNKSQTKVLLDNISGEAREGEIMAVLGASGSGKSTLIDALANRISRGSLKGTITLNDELLDTKVLKVISAYVMQDDLLFPMLTVEETLMCSAEFRLPRNVSKSRKRERVRALIEQLGLESVADTMIGDEGRRGVSGGERRRVSIGTDIIHDPILLFLDEPTSGLDSTSAYMVVKVLQRIARSGTVMIMSIHQPSYRILKLLDRLMILSCGQTVFSGTPGSIPRFFAEFGNPMPLNVDKMEFALDYIRDLEANPGGIQNLADFNKKWENKRSPETIIDSKVPKRSLKEAISASISKGKLVSGATNVGSSSNLSSSVPKYANPFWKEIIVIANRSITNSRRAPEQFGVRFCAVVVTGIILATIFWKLDDSPKGARERLGFFSFATSTTFYTCAEAVPVFLLQRYIFVRETAYNAYRRSSFVVSHAMASIPSLFVLSLAFASITYWSVGLAAGGFSFFLAFVFASFWSGHSFVTFLSGIIFNEMMAYTVVISILAYYVLLSGFFIARDRIPIYWVWFHYASLVKYPYQGVLMNEFGRGGGGTECFVRGTQVFDDSPLRNVADSLKVKLLESMSEALGMSINGSTCLMTGDDILKQSGVVDLGKWSCLWITVASGFLFRVLFYFALMIGGKNKRR